MATEMEINHTFLSWMHPRLFLTKEENCMLLQEKQHHLEARANFFCSCCVKSCRYNRNIVSVTSHNWLTILYKQFCNYNFLQQQVTLSKAPKELQLPDISVWFKVMHFRNFYIEHWGTTFSINRKNADHTDLTLKNSLRIKECTG